MPLPLLSVSQGLCHSPGPLHHRACIWHFGHWICKIWVKSSSFSSWVALVRHLIAVTRYWQIWKPSISGLFLDRRLLITYSVLLFIIGIQIFYCLSGLILIRYMCRAFVGYLVYWHVVVLIVSNNLLYVYVSVLIFPYSSLIIFEFF